VKCYAIGAIEVTDPSWVRDYVENVTRIVERRGGRYLSRTGQVDRLEGEGPAPQTLVIIEWPSKQAAEEFYESEEYRPFRERRIAGAKNDFVLVAGEDTVGTASIDA
jgi:uncharacterized protein (DUF1330 family)